jgi:hypothetical protein
MKKKREKGAEEKDLQRSREKGRGGEERRNI